MKPVILTALALALATQACSAQQPVAVKRDMQPTGSTPVVASTLPKAIIYKMNGDWAMQVPVTLSADRKSIVSFPDPSDLSSSSMPVSVGDDFWLDRRGVNRNTGFLCYTYEQYAALPSAPAPADLMQMLIPGAAVTEIIQLPMTVSEATADPASIISLIEKGLEGGQVIYRRPYCVMPPAR